MGNSKINLISIKVIDDLIAKKETGSPYMLAKKLDISVSKVYELLNYMKCELDAPIIYDKKIKSYKYICQGHITLAFLPEAKSESL